MAAQRGHDAHLYEKSDKLGGQLRLGAVPPGKGEISCMSMPQCRK